MITSSSSKSLSGMARYVKQFPAEVAQAQRLAVADTLRWGRAQFSADIRAQLNLPLGALSGKRFEITQYPTAQRPEGVLSAQFAPLNLARFATTKPRLGLKPKIRVKAGGNSLQLDNSFFIPGPSGGFGLAVRTKTAMRNSRAARRIANNLYILFGPSVDQAFRVSLPKLKPRVADRLEAETLRQIARLTRG